MDFKYYDIQHVEINCSSPLVAAHNLKVVIIEVTNAIGTREYIRTGAGWQERNPI